MPSAVDADETEAFLPPAVWESKQDEQSTWRQVMPEQENWYYPIQLSGGKHENTYLCFADAQHTLPFVLKLLPTSLRSMPHNATGVMDPAALEFRIYSRLQEELESGATLHYPCLYHAELLRPHELTERLVFASSSVKSKLKAMQFPPPCSASKWRAFTDATVEPRFLCLLIEYSSLTSIKAWYVKVRDTMMKRRNGQSVDWMQHGLMGWMSRTLEGEAARSGSWRTWRAKHRDAYPCVPRTYHLQPEWTGIFAPPSLSLVWQSVFFQVMFALEYMHRLLPGFRHFDLHAGNILLMPLGNETHWQNPVYLRYDIDGVMWYVPMVGVTIQLFDFDFAQTDAWKNAKIARQSKGLATKHGIASDSLVQYDTHLFLTSFQSLGHQLDERTRQFLNDMIPKGYRMNQKHTVGKSSKPNANRFRLSYRTDIDHAEALCTPLEVIQHPFFEFCRVKQSSFVDNKVWRLP